MKKLLIVLSGLLTGLYTSAQKLDYDTTIAGSSGSAWNMIVHLPPGYYTNSTDSFQAILFFVGLGEVGADSSKVGLYGPHAYIRGRHWDGGVQLGNGMHYPIIISIQPSASYTRPSFVRPKIDAILSRYRIKRNSLHMTGLSMGGWESTQFASYQPTAGDQSYGRMVRSIVDIEGVKPDDQYDGTPAYPTKFAAYASIGGKFWGFEQCQDGRDIQTIVNTMNAAAAGSATFQATCYGTGAHGYWEHEYGSSANDPDVYVNGGVSQNIYQWMLRQGDTAGDLHTGVSPVVSAGLSQVITLPVNTVTLSGSATAATGSSIVSTLWSKVSGGAASIVTSTGLSTSVTGLAAGSYVFQLTATDNLGRTGVATTTVTVNPAAGAVKTDYDTAFVVSGASWNTIVHLPAAYYDAADSFQCIVYFVNTTEAGTDSSKLAIHGPHGYLRAGWDGGVQLTAGKIYPIIITVQTPTAFQRPQTVKPLIDLLLARYRIKRSSLHFTGLTTGAWVANQFVTYQPTAGDHSYGLRVRSVVNVEGIKPDDSLSYGGTYPQKFQPYAAAGGRELGFEQCQDGRDIQTLVNTMNVTAAGSAYYIQTCYGTGANGFSQYFYGDASVLPQAFTIGGVSQNIYQWMMRQGDTSALASAAVTPVTTVAAVAAAVKAAAASPAFTVYPNPAADRVTVQWKNKFSGEVVIRVLDVTGVTVRRAAVRKTAPEWSVTVDLSGLKTGIYFIQLDSGQIQKVFKR